MDRIRDLIRRVERWAANLPPEWNAVVTSGWHGLVGAVIALAWGGGFAGFAAALTFYGLREAEQLLRGRGSAPWYDRVADVAVPAIVALIIWIL